jgi:hypothetical protein
MEVLDIMGAGNNLLSKWSGFLKDKICSSLTKDKLFPIQIDVPLNYSLFFNIKFHNFSLLDSSAAPLGIN